MLLFLRVAVLDRSYYNSDLEWSYLTSLSGSRTLPFKEDKEMFRTCDVTVRLLDGVWLSVFEP